jgi:hypothetical protein
MRFKGFGLMGYKVGGSIGFATCFIFYIFSKVFEERRADPFSLVVTIDFEECNKSDEHIQPLENYD